MKTRKSKNLVSPTSLSGQDWVFAQTRARELAAVGRETGLAPGCTPWDVFHNLGQLVRNDGWTAWDWLTLGALMYEVPDYRWRRGTCDPVLSYPIQELAHEFNVTTNRIRKCRP